MERMSLFRFGGDLLSHVLRRSTIGATALNGRVRDGIGCFARAIATKPKKRHADFVPQTSVLFQVYAVFDSDVLLLTCSVRPFVWLLLDQIKPIEQLVPVS